jgi:biotin carboxylase
LPAKRILLVAAKLGYQTRVFAETGERLGLRVQLATDRCHHLDNPWGDDAIPLDFTGPVLPGNAGPFDGVVAVGDAPAEAASRIAESLGLPFHPHHAARAARNKFLARQRFAATPGLLVPAFERVRVSDALDFEPPRFPCVVKPLTLSASRGVIRANTIQEYREAVRRIERILPSDPGEHLQVEDFVPGREFAVEGLMTHGKLRIFAIFDKPDPLDGPFFEETIYVTPTRSGLEQELEAATLAAVCALGLNHGPIHAEMRANEEGIWMLEAAARPIGGLCARVLRTASGRSWEEVILRHAAGVDDGAGEVLRSGGSGVMMIPIPRRGLYLGFSGGTEAAAVPGIEGVEITAKEGQEMVPLPEGASYLGFLFAHADTPKAAEAALRTAHSLLRFDIATSLPVIQRLD